AIDRQLLEEVIIRLESCDRNAELICGQLQKLFENLLESRHGIEYVCLWQIRLNDATFNELPQGCVNCRTIKQVTEQGDFLMQFVVGNRLDKPLGDTCRLRIKLACLSRNAASCTQRLPFAHQLAYQTHTRCLGCVNASAREKQIPNQTVAQIAL